MNRSAPTALAHTWTFFRQWLKNPLGVAAISPSSPQLARQMMSELPRGARRVIELGGGTGVFTQALIDHGIPPADLLVLELNEELHQHLVRRFPQVQVACADARDLGDLALALPDFAIEAIREALPAFGKQIKGFDLHDAVLTGIETRTSSPLRITRGADMQSLNVRGLYPAGEGAGYAGGILSAGVDGIRVAEALIRDMLGIAEA